MSAQHEPAGAAADARLAPPSPKPPSPDPNGERMRRRQSPTLYRYLIREMLTPTLFALGAFTLVVLTVDLLAFANLVINRGLGIGAVASVAFFNSVPVVARTLPFAVLVGTLAALGRLGADREILALEASGLWARRLVGPAMIFAGVMTAVALMLSLVVAPWATRTLDATLAGMVRENPGAAVEAGNVQSFGDWRLEAREVSPRGDRIRGVMLWMPSVGETIFAESGAIDPDASGGTRLSIEGGVVILDPRDGARELRFEHMHSVLPETSRELGSPSDWISSATQGQLATRAANDRNPVRALDANVEWHRRIALPIATLCFGFLAVPLFVSRGHFSRAGGATIGALATIVYYSLVQLASGFVRSGSLPVLAGAWLPNLVVAAVAGVMLARHARFSSFGRDADRMRHDAGRRTSSDSGRIRTRRYALPRYVMARFAEMAGLCFVVLLVAFLIVDVLDNLKWFTKYAATAVEVFRFYGARVLVLAARVVPIALLVGAALTVSLLAVQGEVMGMRACGISSARALLPVLMLCASVAVVYYGLTNEVVPRANAMASHVKRTEIKNQSDDGPAASRDVWYRVGDRVVEAEFLDPLRGVAYGITIYELGQGGLPTSRTDARSARHRGDGLWRLEEPVRIDIAGGELTSVTAEPYAELGEAVPAEVESDHLSVSELMGVIDEAETDGYPKAAERYRVDLHAKLAAPIACLLLPALAILFAVGGPPFPTPVHTLVLSAVVAVGHVLLAGVGTSLGYGGAVPPLVAGWGPTLVLLAVAIWLGLRLRTFGQSFA